MVAREPLQDLKSRPQVAHCLKKGPSASFPGPLGRVIALAPNGLLVAVIALLGGWRNKATSKFASDYSSLSIQMGYCAIKVKLTIVLARPDRLVVSHAFHRRRSFQRSGDTGSVEPIGRRAGRGCG